MSVLQSNLWTAASDGDLERVKHLIEVEGMSANAKDTNGYTPMHAAVSWNHPTLLRYLLTKGGSLNVTDNDGDTPLFTVESLEMCKLVLELGADPHLMNNAQQTAAQSVFEDHPEISQFLCTLTGETLPTAPLSSDVGNGDLEEESTTATNASILRTVNARPPEDINSLDPASRQAAIETNNRAGTLLERVQEILLECDRTGEDPEERIKAVVNETVRDTMQAGRQLAEMQVNEGEAGEQTEEQVASAEVDSEKRPRISEQPER